jgi:hypothetical protein
MKNLNSPLLKWYVKTEMQIAAKTKKRISPIHMKTERKFPLFPFTSPFLIYLPTI